VKGVTDDTSATGTLGAVFWMKLLPASAGTCRRSWDERSSSSPDGMYSAFDFVVPPSQCSNREAEAKVADSVASWLVVVVWPGEELRGSTDDGSGALKCKGKVDEMRDLVFSISLLSYPSWMLLSGVACTPGWGFFET
jgi:hypothetical protein